LVANSQAQHKCLPDSKYVNVSGRQLGSIVHTGQLIQRLRRYDLSALFGHGHKQLY